MSARLTLWESMISAEGSWSRSAAARTCRRRATAIWSVTPASFQRVEVPITVCQGGRSVGRWCQEQPVRTTYERRRPPRSGGVSPGVHRCWLVGAGTRSGPTGHRSGQRGRPGVAAWWSCSQPDDSRASEVPGPPPLLKHALKHPLWMPMSLLRTESYFRLPRAEKTSPARPSALILLSVGR